MHTSESHAKSAPKPLRYWALVGVSALFVGYALLPTLGEPTTSQKVAMVLGPPLGFMASVRLVRMRSHQVLSAMTAVVFATILVLITALCLSEWKWIAYVYRRLWNGLFS